MNKNYSRLFTFLCVFGIYACEKKAETEPPAPAAKIESEAPVNYDLLEESTNGMFSAGSGAIASAQQSATDLKVAIDNFLDSPDQENLINAQSKWLQAVLDYRKFSFFRHIGLLEPDTFSTLNRLDYQISSYPIQPGFLDTFGAYKYSGLVHDIGFPLSEESLVNQHGLTDLADVVVGLHAIEFLLYNVGEKRNIADFSPTTELSEDQKERGFENPSEAPNNRRRELLKLQAEILENDLSKLASNWNSVEKQSVNTLWKNLSAEESVSVAKKSLERALTNLMIEIAEFNSDTTEKRSVSPNVINSPFPNRQQFIHNALISTLLGTNFLSGEKKDSVGKHIKEAIHATAIQSLEADSVEKDHWSSIFSHLKQASDLLTQTQS